MKTFCIKPGYTARPRVEYADERIQQDLCQNEVYLRARQELDAHGFRSVLDVGTGGGFKLLKFFRDVKTLGIDYGSNLDFLRETYPDRDWREADISGDAITGYDVLICSDVVEHVEDPDVLMDFIVRCKPAVVIISTPDRDTLTRLDPVRFNTDGPPSSARHIREWNLQEFREYVGGFLKVVDQPEPLPGSSTQYIVAV